MILVSIETVDSGFEPVLQKSISILNKYPDFVNKTRYFSRKLRLLKLHLKVTTMLSRHD
jgi:hypothetical protein